MSKFFTLSLFATSSIFLLAQAIQSTKSSSSEDNSNPYIIPGFDTSQIAQLKEGNKEWDKCWYEPKSYHVCLTRKRLEESFSWISQSVPFKVIMRRNKSGSFSQAWISKNFRINLFRGVDGHLSQDWELPDATWTYSKSAEGEISQKWVGNEDSDAVRHYKSIIDSWCGVNDFYMGKENCIIY